MIEENPKIKKLRYYIDLITVLTIKEIKVKYKKSVLGYFWSVLHPLCLAVIFYFVFKFVIKIPIENFTLYLISGLFPWQWFSNSVSASATSLIGNASLIKKVNFPRYFIPLSGVLNDTFHFVLSLPVIFTFAFYYKIYPTFTWFYSIPLLLIPQFFLTCGCAFIVSSINLFFRDLERIVVIVLNILFYATPIIYDINMVPEKFKTYFLFNPLYSIIEGWHNIFLNSYIDWSLYFVSIGWAFLIFFIGFYLFKRLSWKFAEVI
jgi:lipopolysaccharide transport system permease protein